MVIIHSLSGEKLSDMYDFRYKCVGCEIRQQELPTSLAGILPLAKWDVPIGTTSIHKYEPDLRVKLRDAKLFYNYFQ